MKTPLNTTCAWLALVMAALTGGCVEPTEPKASVSTNTADATASTTAAAASTAGTTNSVDAAPAEPSDPPLLRSGRAARAFPDEVTKVIELVEAGAGEEVTRAYVEKSIVPYELSLDDVLYLRDIGVPDGVVAAMMRRGAEIRHQQSEMAALQTNLTSAVAEIRSALAERNAADLAASTAGGPPPEGAPAPSGTVGTAVAATPGPTPLPQPGTNVPADAPVEVRPFYQSLSPYGSWYQVPSYGWVWQPSVVVVNTGWSPYCQGGRWVWSDWGWYWSSEYSWGWAPFHYGRWCTYPGLGWCWVPGSVWGPSWVTWRSHGTYVGWAPLPPACGWSSGIGLTWQGSGVSVGFGFGLASSCFTFVSYRDFCHRNVGHHALRRDQAVNVYNNSTVVNNVIQGNNNTIVNNGVGYDNIASKSRAEIPKARIEPLPESVDQHVRVDRMERSKDGLVVYRPTPVSEAGGRPTALRAEARPAASSVSSVGSASSGLVAGSGSALGRRPMGIPSRPDYDSRFSASPAAGAPKAVESRGRTPSSVSRPATTSPTDVGAASRPAAASMRNPSPARAPNVGSATATPKAVEGRGVQGAALPNPNGSPNPYGGVRSGGNAVLGPSRQTTPVPLSDPSRYLPRGASPGPRSAAPSASTPKSAYEGRSPTLAPSAPVARPMERSGYAPSAVPNPGVSRPTATPNYSPAPRMTSPQAAPKVDYSRPAAGGGFSPSSSRVPMSAPAAAPSRPAYSAPSPAMSAPVAPRPSFSAPSPAMNAPRPAVSSPSPASASPAPAGRSPSAGGRSQPN